MAIDRVKTKANAEKFLKANRIPEAIRELQKLADDNPRDIQVLNQIGQLHLRQGSKDLAVPCFIKVADLFTKQGFFTKAVASLKIVTREAPENLAAWEMLASLSEQQGFAREAWGAYEKVSELYTRTGNLNGVIDVQKKLLELEPDNLKVQVQLGDNLVKAGRRDEGVKHYLKAGGKLIAQGHVKEAARMYERALQLDPTNFNALEAAVKTHLAHKQADVALQLLDSLLERAPGAEGILLLKADILNETRQFSEAESVCRTVMATSTSSSGAMFRLVRALVMQDRIDDASTAVGDWLKACGPAKIAEAEALYEEILRFKAGHVLSLKGLVEAAPASRGSPTASPRRSPRWPRAPRPRALSRSRGRPCRSWSSWPRTTCSSQRSSTPLKASWGPPPRRPRLRRLRPRPRRRSSPRCNHLPRLQPSPQPRPQLRQGPRHPRHRPSPTWTSTWWSRRRAKRTSTSTWTTCTWSRAR
jgi:tetratricopeptide (TPR) repeat protein